MQKTKKNIRRIAPSTRVSIEEVSSAINWSLTKKVKRSAAKRLKGISLQTTPLVTDKGKIIAAQPRTRKILAVVLPKILPKAIPVLFLTLAIILTKSSGEDVPRATTVRPMTRSDTLNRRAMDVAPSISNPAPLMRNINTIMMTRMDVIGNYYTISGT